MGKEEKNKYEEKAKKLAEENAAKQAEAEKAFNESLAMYPPASGRFHCSLNVMATKLVPDI